MSELPRRVLVLGLAVTGEAAALALAARGVEVVVSDRSPDADPGRLAGTGVELRLGTEDESVLSGVELVVKSPGVPERSPVVAAARERGIPVWSEIELGWRLLPGNPVLGVTGTKGKTTTVRLLGAMFAAAGRRRRAGRQRARAAERGRAHRRPGTWVVCELSSFQLEDVETFACDIAVLLNLEPDHLDRHGTFEAYRDAKLRIFERAKAKIGPADWSRGIEFGAGMPPGGAEDAGHAQPRERGRGDRRRARSRVFPTTRSPRRCARSQGVPHRLELVRELRGVQLRQRLEGDEHRRGAPRRRRVRRADCI